MKKVIVTGACGFIGTCLARRLLETGCQVIGMDNLSRAGSEMNAAELAQNRNFRMAQLDLSNSPATFEVFKEIGAVDAVFHLAGQVAVTTSYAQPAGRFPRKCRYWIQRGGIYQTLFSRRVRRVFVHQ